MATRKKPKKAQETFCSYVIEILNCCPEYSFSLGHDSYEGPHSEHAIINGGGKFVIPERLAGQPVKISIFGDRSLAQHLEDTKKPMHFEPLAVAHVEYGRGRSEAWMSVPFDALPIILQGLNAGNLQYADLYGDHLRHRKARIRRFSLKPEINLEDY